MHVDDVAAANELALVGPTAHDGALNVASGWPISLLEMAELLARADGSGLEPRVIGEFRIGDVRHVVADPAAAESALGYRAAVRPEQGIVAFAADPLRRPPRST